MDCWCVACDEELAEGEIYYDIDDEGQKYHLCCGCSETVDLRLLVLERYEIEV